MDGSRSNGLILALKRLIWEIRDEHGRFEYVNYMVRELPGTFGVLLRRRLISPYFAACGEGVYIHPGVRFRNVHRISLGNNVELGVDNFFQAGGGLTIEDNAILGPGVKIWTMNHKFDDTETPIRSQGYDRLAVVIGPNTWLGANVFVMPGVHLGEGCVVAAGSVLSAKTYPAFSILAGNPARVIGNRKDRSRTTKQEGLS